MGCGFLLHGWMRSRDVVYFVMSLVLCMYIWIKSKKSLLANIKWTDLKFSEPMNNQNSLKLLNSDFSNEKFQFNFTVWHIWVIRNILRASTFAILCMHCIHIVYFSWQRGKDKTIGVKKVSARRSCMNQTVPVYIKMLEM